MKDKSTIIDNMSNNEVTAIVDRVLYLRKKVLKMSQTAFSQITDISQPYLSQIETRQKEISMPVVLLISKNLNVNLDWLLYGFGDDANIFTDISSSIAASRDIALQSFISAYLLNPSDKDFISWYVSLDPAARIQFTTSLSALAALYK